MRSGHSRLFVDPRRRGVARKANNTITHNNGSVFELLGLKAPRPGKDQTELIPVRNLLHTTFDRVDRKSCREGDYKEPVLS